MSGKLPTSGTDPIAANHAWHHDRAATRTTRHAFTIHSDRGRIARKRKKHLYLTERANYKTLLLAVVAWKMESPNA